jgi:hypothetical protein
MSAEETTTHIVMHSEGWKAFSHEKPVVSLSQSLRFVSEILPEGGGILLFRVVQPADAPESPSIDSLGRLCHYGFSETVAGWMHGKFVP